MNAKRFCTLSALATLLTIPLVPQQDRLSPSGSQMWHADVEGVPGEADRGSRFGTTLAWGDFNGDGFDDLAVGAPDKTIGSAREAGAVYVVYGSADIFLATPGQVWDQGNGAIGGEAETGAHFGAALAAGDLNGDGFDDLAIGVPDADIGEVRNAGAVALLFGTGNGLLALGSELLFDGDRQFAPGRPPGEDHQLGYALAIGDFRGNGRPQLVVGMPGARLDGLIDAGAFGVVSRIAGGGGWSMNRIIHQGVEGVEGALEAADMFGSSFAVGDFDGDNFDDLVVGARGEAVGNREEAGAAIAFYGESAGIEPTSRQQLWTQNSAGVSGVSEAGDLFAWSLAAGDLDGDGRDDLAIGIPNEAIGEVEGAGAVQVLYGSGPGLTATGNRLWYKGRLQDPQVRSSATATASSDAVNLVPAGPATPGQRELLGTAVAIGDFDTDGFDDLAIGVMDEDAPGANSIRGVGIQTGAVLVLYGSGEGATADGMQRFEQSARGRELSGGNLGAALAASDWRLAIGAPSVTVGGHSAAGAAFVLYTGALSPAADAVNRGR